MSGRKPKPWYRTPVPVGPCPTCGCPNTGSPTTNLCAHCLLGRPCPQLALPLPKPKVKVRHIVERRVYCASTERYEVFAYCGYSEEAAGSGRHTVNVGDVPCVECHRRRAVEGVPL